MTEKVGELSEEYTNLTGNVLVSSANGLPWAIYI